ncbi:hypothetical protein MKW92_043059 [Papaver armeniacum]|nr:hypothetical protein MKW92_043059 [Papaver armeniacum]
MLKISCLINKKLMKTIFSSSSLVSITTPPSKTSNFLTPILNFSRNLTPRQNFISSSFSHARVINLSFNRNPRSFCCISSPHREIEVNQKIPSSEEANEVSIPVRAYFMFNRIDLKGLMAENQANLIQHTSGKNNYAVLKFDNADF